MKNCFECGEEIEDDDGESCAECIRGTEDGIEALQRNQAVVDEWNRNNPQPDYHGYEAAKRELRYGEPLTPEQYTGELTKIAKRFNV
jgi:hypothetical protein